MKFYYILTLIRPANIVTAISDILAGIAIAGFLTLPQLDSATLRHIALLLIATMGLYSGGIIFNDVFDLKADRINRPERVLPRGLVSVNEAVFLGSFLMIAAVCAAMLMSIVSGVIAATIALLALSYDKISKHIPILGPLNMGLCRGGNLLLGMSINTGFIINHWYIGIVPIVFIAAVTLTAAKEATGSNKTAISIAMILDCTVVALFVLIGVYNRINLWVTLPFILVWYGMNLIAKVRAYSQNEPRLIQKAVKTGVLSLIILNASYVAGFSGWQFALLVICLLPLSVFLAKKFAVT